MSAGAVGQAAVAIRKESGIEENLGHIDQRTYKAWLAVADLLDAVTSEPWCCDECKWAPENENAVPLSALAVARTYLEVTP